MRLDPATENTSRRRDGAFTLVEMIVALAISVSLISGIIIAYNQTCRRAELSGYSLAAQALAIQQLEQSRAAIWDLSLTPVKNETTNLNLVSWTYNTNTLVGSGYCVSTLDLPVQGTNYVLATNFVTVRMLYLNNVSNPPVRIQMVQVDTVWPFTSGRASKLYTNTVATYLAPDNRDVTSL
jgi:prepilin-type N-terminal cleavage/methylation domain-containing protein